MCPAQVLRELPGWFGGVLEVPERVLGGFSEGPRRVLGGSSEGPRRFLAFRVGPQEPRVSA
eukprot:2731732-Alexandrium_andersonii.AAC.1